MAALSQMIQYEKSSTDMLQPTFGWTVILDHQFSIKAKPFGLPRIRQMFNMKHIIARYAKHWITKKYEGSKVVIDNINLLPWKPIYGAPIGGIGCGTIGRGFRGEFCRFQMVPGLYEHYTVDENQFILNVRRHGQTVYQQVLSPRKQPPNDEPLSYWQWEFPGKCSTYTALYPRAWTVYHIHEYNLRITCRQISPVIPHNYKDSCLPGAVFIWTIENLGIVTVDVSITFTFRNGDGSSRSNEKQECKTDHFKEKDDINCIIGMTIEQYFKEMKCVYGISSKEDMEEEINVTTTKFNPLSAGEELWNDLKTQGFLMQNHHPAPNVSKLTGTGIGVAVCAQTVNLRPNGMRQLEFCLTWDQPVIHFTRKGGFYARRYTRWFGRKGTASSKLAHYFFKNYDDWEKEIEKWQNPLLFNPNLPPWYKSALFNELYFISDGGTVWIDHDEGKKQPKEFRENLLKEYGHFAYLEGHEYRMYCTYDVHFYASFALLMLWPKLQLSLQSDFAETIQYEDLNPINYIHEGELIARKKKGCVPHDLGDPDEDPWKLINAYTIHNTDDWKDLNTKYVLTVYRDFLYIAKTENHEKSIQYLTEMYEGCKTVLKNLLHFDTDNDGLIENGGYADQTYDSWCMQGVSAYCGGLWITALKAFCKMAEALDKQEDLTEFQALLDKGEQSFEEKLWNGEYYNFDTSNNKWCKNVMADQLAGYWFLKTSNKDIYSADTKIFPKDHVLKALKKIYQCNVLPFKHGNMGAINGAEPNGRADTTSVQSEEFWTGINYTLAALMIQEGLVEEGLRVAKGTYEHCWEESGLGFQTPEAYNLNTFRSLGYMRPLSIWAIQWALEHFHPHLMTY